MLKRDEENDHDSCLSKARPDERIFVLLARDLAAPAAIRAWVAERLRLGTNKPFDQQIVEALTCADLMEVERAEEIADRQRGELQPQLEAPIKPRMQWKDRT